MIVWNKKKNMFKDEVETFAMRFFLWGHRLTYENSRDKNADWEEKKKKNSS